MANIPLFAALCRAFRKHDGGCPGPCPYSIGDIAHRAEEVLGSLLRT